MSHRRKTEDTRASSQGNERVLSVSQTVLDRPEIRWQVAAWSLAAVEGHNGSPERRAASASWVCHYLGNRGL